MEKYEGLFNEMREEKEEAMRRAKERIIKYKRKREKRESVRVEQYCSCGLGRRCRATILGVRE